MRVVGLFRQVYNLACDGRWTVGALFGKDVDPQTCITATYHALLSCLYLLHAFDKVGELG